MKIGMINPRISYYSGGGEKSMIDSILNVAGDSKDQFYVYTLKTPLAKTRIYKEFKKKAPKNVFIEELEIPKNYKEIYKIPPGEDRFRWDAESLLLNSLILPRLKIDGINLIWVNYILDALVVPIEIPSILNLLGYPRKESDYRDGLINQYTEIVPNARNVINKWNLLLKKKIVKFSLLYPGIDCTKEVKKKEIFRKDKFTIMFAGRFIERKGIKTLIEATEILKKGGMENIEVYLFGEGLFEPKIRKLISSKGLGCFLSF